MAETMRDAKVITGTVRLSYAHVWEPAAAQEGQDKKYSASLIIPKSDKKTIAKINKAIENAKKNGESKFGGKVPKNLKTPLRDGDEDRPDDEAYEDCYFINATSKTAPGVVDKSRSPILDQEEVYSGCYVIASINFYPFNTSGNKGIAAGLNNIMKVKDGDYLGGRVSAEEDFKDIDFSDVDEDDLI